MVLNHWSRRYDLVGKDLRDLLLYSDDCHYKEQSGDNQADQISAKLWSQQQLKFKMCSYTICTLFSVLQEIVLRINLLEEVPTMERLRKNQKLPQKHLAFAEAHYFIRFNETHSRDSHRMERFPTLVIIACRTNIWLFPPDTSHHQMFSLKKCDVLRTMQSPL